MSATEPLPDVAAPQEGSIVASKFRLERVIGEGGMGVVYSAVHLDLVKRVAIKIIRGELASREDLVERMLQEARTAATLRSEHVARVLDVGLMESGAPYIVMEHLDGCDLATHLEETVRMRSDVAVLHLLQACEAVAEAHAAGIVHRDIKPENLFLTTRADGEPIVKMLDFGIARSLVGQGSTAVLAPSEMVGSPNYIAPEGMRRDGAIGPAADIWSLGAVLYELVTGVRPFDADTVSQIFSRALREEPVPVRRYAEVPDELEAIILRCLRKDPSERFASVAELAVALAPFGAPGSVELAERVRRVGSAVVLKRRTAPIRRIDISQTPARTPASGLSSSAPLPPLPRRRGLLRVVAIASAPLALLALLLFARRAAFDAPGAAAHPPVERFSAATAEPAPMPPPPPAVTFAPARVPGALPPSHPEPKRPARAATSARPKATARPAAAEPSSAPQAAAPTAAPTVAASVESAEPAGAPSADVEAEAPTPSPDPWDPEAFGGRR